MSVLNYKIKTSNLLGRSLDFKFLILNLVDRNYNCLSLLQFIRISIFISTKNLNLIEFYLFFLKIFHNLQLHHGILFLRDGIFWTAVTLMALPFVCNGESHAFSFFWLPNHVVGWKVHIDTGDWLYYAEFLASITTTGICYTRE